MTFRLELSGAAAAYLARLDGRTRDRFRRKFEAVEADPFASEHSKPLAGRLGLRAARVGDWRFLFEVDGADGLITVTKIAPRGEVYR